jgi:hypothetical protein
MALSALEEELKLGWGRSPLWAKLAGEKQWAEEMKRLLFEAFQV